MISEVKMSKPDEVKLNVRMGRSLNDKLNELIPDRLKSTVFRIMTEDLIQAMEKR